MMNNLYDNQGYSNGNSYANNGYYGNQNNFYQSPQQMQQNKPMCLKGRPVTSIEEARALSIDLDGTVFYYPDISNRKIYTKQFNPDGSASFKIYVEDSNADVVNPSKYVTQQELIEAITGIKNTFMKYLNIPEQKSDENILNQNQNISFNI